jgi:hypothetical protein
VLSLYPLDNRILLIRGKKFYKYFVSSDPSKALEEVSKFFALLLTTPATSASIEQCVFALKKAVLTYRTRKGACQLTSNY